MAADGDESNVGSSWTDRDCLLFTFVRIGMRLGGVVAAVTFSAGLCAGDVTLLRRTTQYSYDFFRCAIYTWMIDNIRASMQCKGKVHEIEL